MLDRLTDGSGVDSGNSATPRPETSFQLSEQVALNGLREAVLARDAEYYREAGVETLAVLMASGWLEEEPAHSALDVERVVRCEEDMEEPGDVRVVEAAEGVELFGTAQRVREVVEEAVRGGLGVRQNCRSQSLLPAPAGMAPHHAPDGPRPAHARHPEPSRARPSAHPAHDPPHAHPRQYDRTARSAADALIAAGAAAAFAELLADRVRVQGKDHPDTLIARHNLAHWQGEAGDAAGAAADLAELLADQVRVLGDDHPCTLATRGDLARWRGQTAETGPSVE